MSAVFCAALLALAAAPAVESGASVTGRPGGRARTFAHGLDTTIEGLVLTLLGTCSVERDATRQEWDEALQGEHLRVRYPRPRILTANVERHRFEAVELLLTGSATTPPRYIFVRSGDSYRALSKFDGHLWIVLSQRILGGLTP